MNADICLLCGRNVKNGYYEVHGEEFEDIEYTCRSCANKQVKAMEGRLKLVRGLFR